MSMELRLQGGMHGYMAHRLVMTPRIRRSLNPQLVKARTALPKKRLANRNRAPHP